MAPWTEDHRINVRYGIKITDLGRMELTRDNRPHRLNMCNRPFLSSDLQLKEVNE